MQIGTFSPYCEIDYPVGNDRLRLEFSEAEKTLLATRTEEIAPLLAQVENYARGGCWVVGFISYEAAASFDHALKTQMPVAGLPLACFIVYRKTASNKRARSEWLCGPWRDILTRTEFDDAIAAIQRGINDGDYYQINYTTRLRAQFQGDSLGFFDTLRKGQPSTYCAYLDFGRFHVCSVSPELFLDWVRDDEGGTFTCRPMKGTASRYKDTLRDAAAAKMLLESQKERAENLMIVDLIRNDLAKIAHTGSVKVPALFSIESLPSVWQMTSTVTCKGRAGVSLFDVLAALFPCGSITGAPKPAAMAAITKLERAPRGIYCGALGIIRPGGHAQFSIGIRTAVVDTWKGTVECGLGSGIVSDSTSDGEYNEWQAKRTIFDQSSPPFRLLETLRLHQGRYWLLRGHLERIEHSAKMLGFTFDKTRIEAALSSMAQQQREGRVRLLLGLDGDVCAEFNPINPLPQFPTITLAPSAVQSSNPWLRHKTTRRETYTALAVDGPDIFDTLLYNERGELTEFTRGNLVIALDGQRVTPPLTCGTLPGVFRRVLVARKRVKERVVMQDDLARSDAIWFVNSVRGFVPVRLDSCLG
ncbi:MAG TPA: chorismate-binding protein [Gallionella sp.]|nr:chorismate-binding protein [Gallionella sp.]